MTKKKARYFSPEEKVSILREHLLERSPVSDICDKYDLRPNVFYRWQKQFFEQGATVFQSKRSDEAQTTRLKEQVTRLEDKLQTKNEVLSELLEDHIMLKKKSGGH